MSPHDPIPLKQIVFHIQDPTYSKFSDDSIKVQTREIEKTAKKPVILEADRQAVQ